MLRKDGGKVSISSLFNNWSRLEKVILQRPVKIHKFILSDRERETLEITPIRATQSKTNEGNEARYGPTNAIDQDLKTPAGINIENGAVWLKLQFDRTYHVRKIIIYYKFSNYWYDRNSGCIENRKCTDLDNNVDVSVYQGEVKQKSCGTLQLNYGLEQSDQIYTLMCDAEGDTVKLNKSTGNIAVYEVVTISHAPGKQKTNGTQN